MTRAAVGVTEHSVTMSWRCPLNCCCHHQLTTDLINKDNVCTCLVPKKIRKQLSIVRGTRLVSGLLQDVHSLSQSHSTIHCIQQSPMSNLNEHAISL
jgi:hypothetical protein